MARSCGADPGAMTGLEALDLEAYLEAADLGRDPRLGRRGVPEPILEE